MTRPDVSVVVPTRNAAEYIDDLFDGLEDQGSGIAYETVVVDSGSTDGTRAILHRRADRLIDISPARFNHGLSRNVAIEAAQGELVVLVVQDAVPANGEWLQALTEPFAEDRKLAGTFARQLPRADASRVTRYALGNWVAARPAAFTHSLESAEVFAALGPGERLTRCTFDNVCSCVRRSVWRRFPFRETAIAEDLAWAVEVLLAGYRLSYVPRAQVIHSHERSAAYELQRTYLVHKRLGELFGLRLVPSLPSLLRSIVATLGVHIRCLRGGDRERPGLAEIARTLALAFAWPLGQYLGGRAADIGAWQPPANSGPCESS